MDLLRVILEIRDSLPKGNSIRELGDFVAHPNVRTQGPSFERLRDLQQVIRLHVWASQRSSPINVIPEFVPNSLRANLQMFARSSLKVGTFDAAAAKPLLERWLKKLKTDGNGNLSLQPGRTSDEEQVATILLKELLIASTYDQSVLLDDLAKPLAEMGLLPPDAATHFPQLGDMVAMLAVEIMHQATIEIGHDVRMQLKAGRALVDEPDGRQRIGVNAQCSVTLPEHGDMELLVETPFLSTSLLIAERVDRELQPAINTQGNLREPLELSDQWKLQRITG